MLPLRLWHLGRIPNEDLGSDLTVGQLDFFSNIKRDFVMEFEDFLNKKTRKKKHVK